MNKKIPYMAIGNGELADKPKVGKKANCPICGKLLNIEYGVDQKTGEVSKTLGFVSCNCRVKKKPSVFLVAVGGKALW